MRAIALLAVFFFSLSAFAADQKKNALKNEEKQARGESVELKKLPIKELKEKAKSGDSLAGLAVAQQLSNESQDLVGFPVLANDAAEEAVKWYSLAAKIGALDNRAVARVGTPPIRAMRVRK